MNVSTSQPTLENDINYQKKFFDIINKRNQKGYNIHYEIMDQLGIKRGAAYKRMNGDLSLIHIPSPRDKRQSRMPSSA